MTTFSDNFTAVFSDDECGFEPLNLDEAQAMEAISVDECFDEPWEMDGLDDIPTFEAIRRTDRPRLDDWR